LAAEAGLIIKRFLRESLSYPIWDKVDYGCNPGIIGIYFSVLNSYATGIFSERRQLVVKEGVPLAPLICAGYIVTTARNAKFFA
jgi:hypothetical protein